MARTADRIHIPNLDPKFIAARNPDNNWLIARFIENVDTLNKLTGNLPRRAPWNYKTADQFSLMAASIQQSVPEADRELRKVVCVKFCKDGHGLAWLGLGGFAGLGFEAYRRKSGSALGPKQRPLFGRHARGRATRSILIVFAFSEA
jgi:hypothetical protein